VATTQNQSRTITEADQFGRVAVLYGGTSAEREVSLNSGKAVLAALCRNGVDAYGIDTTDQPIEQMQADSIDRVFIVLHGRGGEDGVIQAILQSLNLPYTGSGVQGSALAMDKLRTKLLWLGMKLPTPDFVILSQQQDLALVNEAVGFPCIIKPIHEGSSIGMSKVDKLENLEPAWKEAAKYDREVIAERWITGGEYTCAILNNEALPLIKMETPNTFYDYEAKYNSTSTQYHCPCGLAVEKEKEMQDIALLAFDACGASGWGRVDFMMDEQNQAWLIEANTVPGMTDHSLVPMAAKQAGYDFDELVWRILESSFNSTHFISTGGG